MPAWPRRRAPAPRDPAAPAAERFGLRLKDLKPQVREALAVLAGEAARAEADLEALRTRLADAEAMAGQDTLIPQVLNRRAFMASLHRVLAYVQRYNAQAAVLYIDLDGFKAVNDGFGHPAGDAVLRHMGRFLTENVRESDVVGRLGGDEFGVILAQAGKDEARAKAQRLETLLAASPCIYEGVTHPVRASFGVHVIADKEDAETALARADEAMYAAKKGRAFTR